MSTQFEPLKPVRLVIAETSDNVAQKIDSLLRDAGIATRMEVVPDLSLASSTLGQIDLLLCNAGLPDLKQALPQLRALSPDLPIITITKDHGHPFTAEQGMLLGASDVVPWIEPKRLLRVCQRELNAICQTRQLSQVQKALAEAEQRCQLLLESANSAICYIHEGMHIHANDGYLKLFGFDDEDELIGLPIIDLLAPESQAEMKSALKAFRIHEDATSFDFAGTNAAGHEVNGTFTLMAAEYDGEQCIQITVSSQVAGTAADATQAADSAADAEAADTPVSNGAASGETENGTAALPDAPGASIQHFIDAAKTLFESNEQHRCNSFFVAQIDDFAKLQGFYGVAGTEKISRQVEAAIRSVLANRPTIRISPAQFAFAVSDFAREQVTDLVQSVRGAVENLLFEVNERTVRPTITCSGAQLSDESDPDATLTRALDHLHKLVEMQGGNVVELASAESEADELDDEAGRILHLINEAIENQRFVLLFQPIISLRGDDDEHYEVFLRMLDGEGEQLVPHEFLQTAIDYKVAGKIDRWVVLEAIKQLSAHRSAGHDTRLTINITSNSVIDNDFVDWLGMAIKAARLPSDAVIFQVTEQDARNYVRQTRELVEQLANIHCRAALSRFGRSEDSFELLEHIPFEIVKIDGYKMDTLASDSSFRDGTISLLKKLQDKGKLTIVPMVESAGVLSTLWQAGANYIQGHYLQEPSTTMDYDFSNDD